MREGDLNKRTNKQRNSTSLTYRKVSSGLTHKIRIPVDRASEKAMAPHSSTLAWKIPWTEEPGGLQSMGSLGVGHD